MIVKKERKNLSGFEYQKKFVSTYPISEDRSRRELCCIFKELRFACTRLPDNQKMALASDSSVVFDVRDTSDEAEHNCYFYIVFFINFWTNTLYYQIS